MKSAAVITTFPDDAWDVYAEKMLKSIAAFWPEEIPVMVQLDSGKYQKACEAILRPADGVACGMEKDHEDFIKRNAGRDEKENYRKQAVRFCHKVFALRRALKCIRDAKAANESDIARYLIWMDADVIITRKVTGEDIDKCLPKEGDAVSYLGRKDWDHSECGWLAFDLENGGDALIDKMVEYYTSDGLFALDQWHDSWVFDVVAKDTKKTNLTDSKPGMDIWQHSPMAEWSHHYKGPVAKNALVGKQPKTRNLVIQTKNSVPDETIKGNIAANQTKIDKWVVTCEPTDDEIVVVSAGPMLVPEDLQPELDAGRKIVAVKHALEPLKEAGIIPWACILLDPRPHVNDFVKEPDNRVIYIVASQVDTGVVDKLLAAGCTVWGYHASVGANETELTDKQPDSVVGGGSATATRGLFVLNKLGFTKFRLYGYDLCLGNRPQMEEKDEFGQPKYFEAPIQCNHEYYKETRTFWSKAELLAQCQEMIDIITKNPWQIKAFGSGIIPFMVKGKEVNNLRLSKKKHKIHELISYEELLGCKKTNLLTRWVRRLHKTLPITKKIKHL